MEYAAIFKRNHDSTVTITFPDLPGCITEAKPKDNPKKQAKAALRQWLSYLEDERIGVPRPTPAHRIAKRAGEEVALIKRY